MVGREARDAAQQAQEADGAMVEEVPRYPGRERRMPTKYKDFEMGEGGTR